MKNYCQLYVGRKSVTFVITVNDSTRDQSHDLWWCDSVSFHTSGYMLNLETMQAFYLFIHRGFKIELNPITFLPLCSWGECIWCSVNISQKIRIFNIDLYKSKHTYKNSFQFPELYDIITGLSTGHLENGQEISDRPRLITIFNLASFSINLYRSAFCNYLNKNKNLRHIWDTSDLLRKQ